MVTVTEKDPLPLKQNRLMQPGKGEKARLGEGLEYGAAIKVGDKTYEIVVDARDTTNRNNTAIVVDDLTDTAATAEALAKAIQEDVGDYTVSTSGSTVTIESNKIGSDQVLQIFRDLV